MIDERPLLIGLCTHRRGDIRIAGAYRTHDQAFSNSTEKKEQQDKDEETKDRLQIELSKPVTVSRVPNHQHAAS